VRKQPRIRFFAQLFSKKVEKKMRRQAQKTQRFIQGKRMNPPFSSSRKNISLNI